MSINKVIFLDTETTGIDFSNDEIIQVSAILVNLDTRDIESTINYYFESEKEIPSIITAINGYYTGKWKIEGYNPITRSEGAKLLFKFLDDYKHSSVIVCHNAPFDRAFCSNFLFTHGNIPHIDQFKYWFDTATVAFLFNIRGTWIKSSLNYCQEQLHIQYQRKFKHDALDDCFLLKEVFFGMLDRITVIS